jgi:transcriptional adapter 3
MPIGSQKGMGKKGGGVIRQRSRNTTPSSALPGANLPQFDYVDAEYLELRVEQFRALNNDDIVDQGAANAVMPDARSLDGMVTRLHKLQSTVDLRSNFYDKGMRILATARKNRIDDDDDRPATDVEEKERKKTKKRKAADALAPQEVKLGTN